ncbi:MAG: nucleotide pyrophosphohydrolase [Bradymonadales bacterium]|jgi:dCTP diphosphatase
MLKKNELIHKARNGDLRAMTEVLRRFNDARHWAQFHSPRNLAMALSSEAAELLSLFLWCTDEGPQPASEQRRAKVAEEAADCLICLLNFCDRAGVDLGEAFLAKLEKNEANYPVERAIDCAKKYDEFD